MKKLIFMLFFSIGLSAQSFDFDCIPIDVTPTFVSLTVSGTTLTIDATNAVFYRWLAEVPATGQTIDLVSNTNSSHEFDLPSLGNWRLSVQAYGPGSTFTNFIERDLYVDLVGGLAHFKTVENDRFSSKHYGSAEEDEAELVITHASATGDFHHWSLRDGDIQHRNIKVDKTGVIYTTTINGEYFTSNNGINSLLDEATRVTLESILGLRKIVSFSHSEGNQVSVGIAHVTLLRAVGKEISIGHLKGIITEDYSSDLAAGSYFIVDLNEPFDSARLENLKTKFKNDELIYLNFDRTPAYENVIVALQHDENGTTATLSVTEETPEDRWLPRKFIVNIDEWNHVAGKFVHRYRLRSKIKYRKSWNFPNRTIPPGRYIQRLSLIYSGLDGAEDINITLPGVEFTID